MDKVRVGVAGYGTIGQRLANLLDLEFLDCDHELEAVTGASVSLIFDVEGEEGFRTRETRMLEELTERSGVLIATGGGVILREENRKMLSERGTVVYLRTSVSQQLRRLSRDKSRPLLQTADRRAQPPRHHQHSHGKGRLSDPGQRHGRSGQGCQ